MRRVSLTARMAHEEANSDEVLVMLIMVTHPSLAAPVRVSTDPTERLSIEPPLMGTRSSWMGADPDQDPYLFAVTEAELPGDQEDAPAGFTLVLTTVDADVANLLTSFTDWATAHLALVFASQPDVVEEELRNAKLIVAEGGAGEIVLTFSRKPIEDETVPTDGYTKDRFPGLFR